MTEQEFQKFLEKVWRRIDEPMITAKFGDNWKEWAKENHSHDDSIEIAFKQGRRAILLEDKLKELMLK